LLTAALLLVASLLPGHVPPASAQGRAPAVLIGHLRLEGRVKAKESILRAMLTDALISSRAYSQSAARAAAAGARRCGRARRLDASDTCWTKVARGARAPFVLSGEVAGDGAVCHVRLSLRKVHPPATVRSYAQSLAPCDRKVLRVEMQRAGQALAKPAQVSTVGAPPRGRTVAPAGPGRSVPGLTWVDVPGGSFTMGRSGGNADERPPHRVTVPGFRISKTETTVAMYRACVAAGGCNTEQLDGSERFGPGSYSRTHYCNWNHSDREDHPLNCVTHKQATDFARWLGGGARLCSEAEFEYAARSGGRDVLYPWGNAEPSCELTIMSDGGDGCGVDRSWPVCSRPRSNTSHGVCDMAGNVREWVADQYHDTFNGAPTDGSAWMAPTGKSAYREGCWVFKKDELHVFARDGEIPGYSDFDQGFRVCAGGGGGSAAPAPPAPAPAPTPPSQGPPPAEQPTWVRIPGGSFTMGRNGGNADERPAHRVRVPEFEIMQTEVTVAMYRACVAAGACDTDQLDGSERFGPGSYSHSSYCNWNYRDREDHPLNCVTHKQAQAFTRWLGGGARLCSEAEFEYAARSGGRDVLYPWGNAEPSCEVTIMSDGGDGCGVDRSWPVCSRPKGNTTHGVCDMAGNVREWVADQYHATFEGAPTDGSAWMTPSGKDAYREGCWVFKKDELHVYSRDGEVPNYSDFDQGFRACRTPGASSAPAGGQTTPAAAFQGPPRPDKPTWVGIPGGTYMMGRDGGNSDERPVHRVRVPDFSIMLTEVTVAMYRACVAAGACDTHRLHGSERSGPGSFSRTGYCNWNHSDREDHPLNCVSHKQALAFARWVGNGARLCSEAEFEYAARSGGQDILYPWGNAEPTCEITIMSDGGDGCGVDRSWPICSRPRGNSTQGVCDLAGNVREWVADQYHPNFVGAPSDGSAWMDHTGQNAYREGCWVFKKDELHAYSRDGEIPGYRDFDQGFRLCSPAR